MKPVLALSTSWCSQRHTDGYPMLREMAALGFEYVELSHGIRIALVPGIMRAVEEGVVKISSTHNFCPLPPGVMQAAPNLFEPSAVDERSRQQWVRQTKRSIDFAAQIEARVLVCHLGSIRFLLFNPGEKIARHLRAHPEAATKAEASFAAVRERALGKLRARKEPYWSRTVASIKEVLEHAAQRGVKLGFENREKFEELPLDGDFSELFSSLPPGAPVGYWHDTGHARLKEEMGLLKHREHLEKNASRLLGFHLHDVSAKGDDHQPVGSGSIDFGMVSSFWRPEHLLTIELSPRANAVDVANSKLCIEALLAGSR